MDKDNKTFLKKHGAHVVLAVIIILQLIYAVFVFVCKKDGFHSDEPWSYGLANSYYRPFVYFEDGILLDNYTGGYEGSDITQKWIDGSVMKDYVTVNEGQQFSYGSVYHNQTLDHHPPLYYFILHTVCSFFPGKFSFWYGFAINLVCMVFIQIFLFRLVNEISKNRIIALLTCLFYGAGLGALSTVIFIRQYCLITMLTMIYYYFNTKLIHSYDKDKGFDLKHYLPPVAIVSFLLFFTNYTMCIVCGVFTALVCIYMIYRMKIKQMFIYGISMTGAVGAFLAAYPSVLTQYFKYHELYGNTKLQYGYKMRIRFLLNGLLRHTVGIRVYLYNLHVSAYFLCALVVILALGIPLCFLFRKEQWFRNAVNNIKSRIKSLPDKLKNSCWIVPIIFISNLVFVMLVPTFVDVIPMGYAVVRYVIMVMPVICLTVVYAVSLLLSKLPKKSGHLVTLALVIAVLVRINMCETSPFVFVHSKNYTDLAKLSAGKNVVLLASGATDDAWMIQCFPTYLRDSNGIFITYTEDDKSFAENTDGRKVDLIIAPVGNFDLNGKWIGQLIDTDERIDADHSMRDIIGDDDSVKKIVGNNEGIEKEEGKIYADDHIAAIDMDGKAKLEYIISVQEGFYAVINLD